MSPPQTLSQPVTMSQPQNMQHSRNMQQPLNAPRPLNLPKPQNMPQPSDTPQPQTPAVELEFIPPCLPCIAMLPPPGDSWLHEVKRDGRRMLARRDGTRVRLFNARGDDWTIRFPDIAEAVGMLPIRS